MRSRDTALSGVKVIEPKRIGDQRGFFSEVYNSRDMAEIGVRDVFVQDNHSLSIERGVVRGLHFQRPPHAQVKLLRVTRGAIFDVAVDIRVGSPTYGKYTFAELSSDNWLQLYIPCGFAHGFATLTQNTEVIYKASGYYAPLHDFGLRWDDPDIGIPWPVKAQEAILSDRDRKHPFLRDLKSPFRFEEVVS